MPLTGGAEATWAEVKGGFSITQRCGLRPPSISVLASRPWRLNSGIFAQKKVGWRPGGMGQFNKNRLLIPQ